ncbi:hypothetical protein GCM10010885_00700 [Alicyclobacillus cellulosilyticus]|uniref:DUF370 domain-containing protein n=1 Tax=Alicyclobacillus cellulosilyticus TaxID=1003997 RepID=A0A917NF58_9BACL|nr:extracellular matrix/biofilm biosynthesis regulator RemA family protein [Alicyclobacillus cellulosilyticus]GGI95010.1 hypothetical protein GCM10010885_00700 [Alicyclobacillus cellulosilyticus]
MFIHIGGDTMVSCKEVIGIFDINSANSPGTSEFLKRCEERLGVEVVEVGEIKSFIVTDRKLYYSPISSLTLKKRAEQFETGRLAEET